MSITYRGEKFSGYNKPKRTPGHKTKSHAVLAKSGDKVKLIRFGQKGVSGAGKKQDAKSKARRKSFKARHAKNIAKGKMSAAYWANKTKWQRGNMPYSKKQMKIARMAPPRNKITGADFAMLKQKKKKNGKKK